MSNLSESLVGKTIAKAEVDGFGIRLQFSDGFIFDFDASDGGYSCYELYEDESSLNDNVILGLVNQIAEAEASEMAGAICTLIENLAEKNGVSAAEQAEEIATMIKIVSLLL